MRLDPDDPDRLHPRHWGGHRVKETATHYVDVMPMLYNHRVVTVPRHAPLTVDRGWCYPTLEAAVLAVHAWDPETQDAPVGWVKEVHTGRAGTPDPRRRRRPGGESPAIRSPGDCPAGAGGQG